MNMHCIITVGFGTSNKVKKHWSKAKEDAARELVLSYNFSCGLLKRISRDSLIISSSFEEALRDNLEIILRECMSGKLAMLVYVARGTTVLYHTLVKIALGISNVAHIICCTFVGIHYT